MSKILQNEYQLTGDVGLQSGNSFYQLSRKKTFPQKVDTELPKLNITLPSPTASNPLQEEWNKRYSESVMDMAKRKIQEGITKTELDNAAYREAKNQNYVGFGALGDQLSGAFGNVMTLGAALGNQGVFNAGMFGGALSSGLSQLQNLKSVKGLKGADLAAAKKNNLSVGMGAIGSIADGADKAFFGDQEAKQSSLTQGIDTGYDMASDAAMTINPMVGGAMKLAGLATDVSRKMGLGTDQTTTADKIFGSKFLALTPEGLINSLGAKKTNNFSVDRDTMEYLGSDYGGTSKDLFNAQDIAGKKVGLFSSGARRRMNNQINLARNKQQKMTDIANEARDQRDMVNGTQQLNWLNYTQNLNGGLSNYRLAARNGAKLRRLRKFRNIEVEKPEVSWEPNINSFKEGGSLDTWKFIYTPKEIEEFKDGGQIEPLSTQENVIPDGALHKNKHHMDNDENITKKGIPVVDNDGQQQAEIELNEIIFSLEVTKKLEELYNKFKQDLSQKEKDDVAIEAGKLLVYEILYHTKDNTGLLNTISDGES